MADDDLDTLESTLKSQCLEDLKEWGFDRFQAEQKASRILANAKAAVDLAEWADKRLSGDTLAAAIETHDTEVLRQFTHKMADGVTVDDVRWYWNLVPLARAMMEEFDKELRAGMWFTCHSLNLCIEDLDRDVRRRLPVFDFGTPHNDDRTPQEDGEDAPLPCELHRRFILFVDRMKQKPDEWSRWNDRLKHSSSMNAIIRQEIRAGRL